MSHTDLHLTWSIRDGPDEGGQHLDSSRGVCVTAESILHFPAEAVLDVLQRVVRETHGVQVLINLENRRTRKGMWKAWSSDQTNKRKHSYLQILPFKIKTNSSYTYLQNSLSIFHQLKVSHNLSELSAFFNLFGMDILIKLPLIKANIVANKTKANSWLLGPLKNTKWLNQDTFDCLEPQQWFLSSCIQNVKQLPN